MFKVIFILLCGFIVGAIVVNNQQYFTKTIAIPTAFFPDGGEYQGALLKGEPTGEGRIVWPDGSYFEGEFKAGLFDGYGELNKRTFIYKGEFEKGVARGTGEISFEDKRVYKGDVDNAEANGVGVLVFEGGEYQGQFKNNQFDGEGKLTKKNGDVYEGQFKEGLFNGEGQYTSADGKIYKGQFVDGAISGAGEYRDGEASYSGEFKNWLFNGFGEYKDKHQRYEGDFISGEYSGLGQYTNKNGVVYKGEFLSGLYHGQGELIEGIENYKGGFEYGERHGDGVLTYSKPIDGITTLMGVWRYGQLISSDNPLVEYDESKIVEDVLYKQSDRLSQALSLVEPNDPEKTEMYFVGVAGDGDQGVFRRELNFIRDQFDSVYGTKNKSISLMNGNVLYKTVPLATNTSIERALVGVANKMDPENDILFIYLTSHGSDDFKFQLKQQGLSLPSISADTLGNVIKALPVRYKVVVISACYSGGFIAPIKDESTMVITAASADKTSFGCSDNSTMTYFGEAFFKDALPLSTSFVEAFDRARDIVRGREARENFTNSNPLIFKPQSIRDQLMIWRQELSLWQEEQNRIIE